MRIWPICLAFGAILIADTAGVCAQATVVSVEVADAGGPPSDRLLATVARWLGDDLPPAEAAREYERRRSLPGDREAGTGDVSRVTEQSRQVVDLLRSRRVRQAREAMGELLGHAKAAHSALQRHEDAAQTFLHACVEYVTALNGPTTAAARRRALDEALHCRARVRDLPIPVTTPSDVIGVFAEADSILDRREENAAPVRVTTSRAGCAVYLDGIWTGTTPLTVRRPVQGELAVQVQCTGWKTPGRAHIVHPGPEPLDLRIDGSLERALDTDNGLRLRYPSDCAAARRAGGHGAALAAELDLQEVALLWLPQGSVGARLSVVQADGSARHWWIELDDLGGDTMDAWLAAVGSMSPLPESVALPEHCR